MEVTRRWRPLAVACALVVLGHLHLFSGLALPTVAWQAAAPAAMTTRLLAPAAAPESAPEEAQARAAATEAIAGAPARADNAEPVRAPDGAKTALPSTHTASSPFTTQVGPLPLQGTGVLRFQFTQGADVGEATLAWTFDAGRYSLTLRRQAGGRYWPEWHSEGRTGPAGLRPLLHRVQRDGKVRERLRFEPDTRPPRMVAGSREIALPPGAQDRLSWWIQLSALAAARPGLRPGQSLVIPVAQANGVASWRFMLQRRTQGRSIWVREAPHQVGRPVLRWTLELDDARSARLAALSFSLDGEPQWALRLLESPDSASAPP